MSGRGEAPERDDEDVEPEPMDFSMGQMLYTEDGEPVGTIRGMESGGLFITLREGVEELSVEHARSGHSFGEAELMWRCTECGEMGQIEDGLPEQCPNCNSEREALMYWTED